MYTGCLRMSPGCVLDASWMSPGCLLWHGLARSGMEWHGMAWNGYMDARLYGYMRSVSLDVEKTLKCIDPGF